MDLEQLVRDLMRRRVELVVSDGGQPSLHIPDTLPAAQAVRARAAAEAGLDVLAANRDRVTEVWRRVAKEGPPPERCEECRSLIYSVPDPVSRWAFCESRLCPHRTDDPARLEKWKRARDKERHDHERLSEIPD